jgi:molybdate transport system regulatory protein
MDTLSASQAAKLLHLNLKRVQQLARMGRLPAVRVGRKWLFHRDELERLLKATGTSAHSADTVTLSARNQLRARVAAITIDGLMAEVRLKIDDQEIVSVITRSSAERLGLAVGTEVYAVIKATEVMIGRGAAA